MCSSSSALTSPHSACGASLKRSNTRIASRAVSSDRPWRTKASRSQMERQAMGSAA
jgi:hypothetical protein